MSEETVIKKVAPAAQVSNPEVFDLTLDEYCRRLAAGKVGKAMIGGFFQSQKAAGKFKASEASFNADFDVFAKQSA